MLGGEVRLGHFSAHSLDAPAQGDKWHLDEMIVSIGGEKHWLWRAVDQHGAVLDVLVQRRRDAAAAKRLMRKLLKRHGLPRVMVTDKLRSYAAANTALRLGIEHRQHKGAEQPGGEFASADSGAREGDAAVHISSPTAAIRFNPRSGFEPVHWLPLSPRRATEARGPGPGNDGQGKGVVRPLGDVDQSMSRDYRLFSFVCRTN